MDSPASLGYRKEQLIKNLKKYVTRLGFEHATSCVAIGYSKYLAIDQKEKLIKNWKKKKKDPSGIRTAGLPTFRNAGG